MKSHYWQSLAIFALATCGPYAADAQETTSHSFRGEQGAYVAERIASGLSQPAAIQIMPDGTALVMQRDLGLITRVDLETGELANITGIEKLQVWDDAGAHDIELHPGYGENRWIYISYSVGERVHSTLALDRIRIEGNAVTEQHRLFTASANAETQYHFGGRIQLGDGYVFLSIGDRQHPPRSQDRTNHAGSIVRLHDDGRVPEDNPFTDPESGRGAPLPEIWSYGHRNPQGLYFHPDTGELWANEHGPRGGDELNLVKRGANYGWPEISFGFEYDGGPIGKGIVTADDMEQPVWVYVPSIAPSDLLIYEGGAFPGWIGNFFICSLALTHLNRLVVNNGRVMAEERLANSVLGRIRSIAADAAGLIYLGTDSGDIWRLKPE